MSPLIWLSPESGTLKVNTGVAVVESRIGIGIIVRNYLGILLIAEALTCEGRFSSEYGEFLGIIKDYVVGSSLSISLIIESDSLLAISSLSSHVDDCLELGALSSYFLHSINSSNIIFFTCL